MSAPAVISLDPKTDWMEAGDRALASLVSRYHDTGKTFTADDVHQIVGEPDDSSWPGSLFRAARRRGEIVKTHAYVQSTRTVRKGSTIAVWRAAK